jgi:hypothetical protein
MKLPRRNFLHLTAGAAALPVVPRTAFAQAYPTRPVRLIVGFAPSGAKVERAACEKWGKAVKFAGVKAE